MICVCICWTHFSSVTTCLSVFRACSRLWVCSSSLSMATWCCFLCCSSSRSATCRAFTLLLSLHTSTVERNTSAHMQPTEEHREVSTYVFMLMWHLTCHPTFCVHARSSPGSSVSHSVLLIGKLLELSEPHSPWPAVNIQNALRYCGYSWHYTAAWYSATCNFSC